MPDLHPSDEDLILYFYGEGENAAAIAAALDASPAARARYTALERVLRAADAFETPEPLAGYGSRVWRRVEARLAEEGGRRRSRLIPAARLAWAAVAIVAVGAAFFVGRSVTPPEPPAEARVFTAESRQRILHAAVAHHLEDAERLLVELDNGGVTLSADFAAERRRAEELVAANRLYRQAARDGDLGAVDSLLDELEPFLLEIAHVPATPEASAPLRARLAQSDLLFKLRISTDRLQRQARPPLSPPRSGDIL